MEEARRRERRVTGRQRILTYLSLSHEFKFKGSAVVIIVVGIMLYMVHGGVP
jgi:hypothetical protein